MVSADQSNCGRSTEGVRFSVRDETPMYSRGATKYTVPRPLPEHPLHLGVQAPPLALIQGRGLLRHQGVDLFSHGVAGAAWAMFQT